MKTIVRQLTGKGIYELSAKIPHTGKFPEDLKIGQKYELVFDEIIQRYLFGNGYIANEFNWDKPLWKY
jgi:hypothetical protein